MPGKEIVRVENRWFANCSVEKCGKYERIRFGKVEIVTFRAMLCRTIHLKVVLQAGTILLAAAYTGLLIYHNLGATQQVREIRFPPPPFILYCNSAICFDQIFFALLPLCALY